MEKLKNLDVGNSTHVQSLSDFRNVAMYIRNGMENIFKKRYGMIFDRCEIIQIPFDIFNKWHQVVDFELHFFFGKYFDANYSIKTNFKNR